MSFCNFACAAMENVCQQTLSVEEGQRVGEAFGTVEGGTIKEEVK